MKKIGILGCGRIAQVRHIPELAQNANVQLAGYYNPTRSRAEEMARKYGGQVYDSVEQMLEDNSIDAVVVCLANSAHAPVCIRALQAGKDVLCEKPMATTLEECEAMVQASKQSGHLLLIAQNQRLTRAHQEAKRMILEGKIGRVLTFRTTFGHGGPERWSINPGKGTWFFNKEKAAMGAMADLGIHKTDLIQWLLSEPVVKVSAHVTTLDKTGPDGTLIPVDDNAICIYTLRNGITGSMTASWTYYGTEDNSTIIYGTEGILRIYQNPEFAIELIEKDGKKTPFDVEPIQTNDHQTRSGMTDLFIEAIETGKETGLTAREVLPAMRAIFAALESSRTGQAIDIPENKDL